MNLANLFKIALKALGNNKFRGFLTMLGIIIGVAAVIIRSGHLRSQQYSYDSVWGQQGLPGDTPL